MFLSERSYSPVGICRNGYDDHMCCVVITKEGLVDDMGLVVEQHKQREFE